ncbi:TRADD-N-associated membrane domain-containing protein [Roseimaritima sediminicola]|uniref:TRADD-N-associated membrane domain-containing protein n=1 Tax=Roseimaritima sediminicola TaxID=2662066 RepID=UPI00129842A2|nr:hypothetical protein [Roseimaritima sediminicola]
MGNLDTIIAGIAASISVAVAVASLVAAIRTGVLKRLDTSDVSQASAERPAVVTYSGRTRSAEPPVAFETEQLAQFYSQVLSQSRISFWFSLVFASLGFAVIVIAAALYTSTDNTASTVAQFIAGLVIDAVAGLFFVQSRRAQDAMGTFFDKLREDRLQLESRRLCETIENPVAKDALKVDLALFYAGVVRNKSSADAVVGDWLTKYVERSHRPRPAD